MKLILILTSLLLAPFAALSATDVFLVQHGQPCAEIVLHKDAIPATKLAATDFQKHIKLISGAELPIVDKPGDRTAVYIGDSEYSRKLGVTLSDIKGSGYKVVVRSDFVVLAGRDIQHKAIPMNLDEWRKFSGEKYERPQITPGMFVPELGIGAKDDTGSLYATSELLEQLGVRWYMPYENGTVIPMLKDIAVHTQELLKETNYMQRETTFYHGHLDGKMPESTLWLKHLRYGNAVSTDQSPHGLQNVLAGEEQRREHPEYFAMADGKMIDVDHGGKPRLIDSQFRASSIKYADKAFEVCPDLWALSLGMPDGLGRIDERDAKLFPPAEKREGMFSSYVWDYWIWAAAELKKRHPDKYMTVLSYTSYQDPPPNFSKVPDNVLLGLVIITMNLAQPDKYAYFNGVRDQWLQRFSPETKLQTYDHFLFYLEYAMPRYPVFFTKLLQEQMQKTVKFAEARFIESEATCPGLYHFLNYWQAKLLWDADADREQVLNEYYDLYYGPAKAEMKEFYEFAEAVWMRPESRSVSKVGGFLKEPDVDHYFDILQRAREKAGKHSVFDKRIAMIETEMEPLKKLFPNMHRVGPELTGFHAQNPFVLDGNFDKPFWTFRSGTNNAWSFQMVDLVTGKLVPAAKTTRVSFRMTQDRAALVLGVQCNEPNMDHLVTTAKNDHDDFNIFNDDVIEIYLETPERSYFKIAVNSDGKIWDESQDVTINSRDTLPTMWNPGIKAVVIKEKERWLAEILIPVKDFGSLGPNKSYPWGINVCRNRLAGGTAELSALSPTGKPTFLDLSKLGNLIVR